MADGQIADALNRIADALFQQAKALRAQTKVAERQLVVAEEMAEMQKANLAVTKHLEAELALRAGGSVGGSS
jgi:hypothetical protein